jgi:DNA-binding response OmpR family regulator
MRVLVVEDDRRLAATLRRGFTEDGLGVDTVADGAAALASARVTSFDVIVLDVMLPGELDGLAVCAELRRARVRTPVLMLTARDAVADRIAGLEAGADDYLIKPFAFSELLARVRALTRRHLADRSAIIAAGGIRLDTGGHTATVNGTVVELRTKEFAVLQYFMHHPGILLTRRQIEDHVWTYDFDSTSNLVEVYVGRIRRKILAAGGHDPIVTIRGSGYRFEAAPQWNSSDGTSGGHGSG